MKRRLSLAMAFVANPAVCLLDEPTSGMDCLAKRDVWQVIEKAKAGRSIVLTTHSMEEADYLSNRIGIMKQGGLFCLGTSLRLKQALGTGYQVGYPVATGTEAEAMNELKTMF